MSRVDHIENRVKALSPEELAVFREWFVEYDAEIWDHQFAADVKAGRLDRLAERALRDHASGLSTEL
jgi:hypothetical protein